MWDTRAIGPVPLSIAFAAGGLAVVNPCGFPLLPAFLSFYLGAEERQLPGGSTRLLQGVGVGALVALGFLGSFALIGLPVSFGLGAVAHAVPWLGLATGVALTLAGLGVMAGRRLALPVAVRVPLRRDRRVGSMVLFGVAYGAASLGCTLPVFLALIGASVGAGKLGVFVAYGAGMTIVLTALGVAVAGARQGLARRLRPAMPHAARIAGGLLTASGAYLVYYWLRVRFGDGVTLADDPIVGFAARYSADLQGFAERHGLPLLLAAGAVVAVALAGGARRRAVTGPARR